MRLFFPSEALRGVRIAFLKLTHCPYVAAIWLYEKGRAYFFEQAELKSRPVVARPTSYLGGHRHVAFTTTKGNNASPASVRVLAARSKGVALDGQVDPFSSAKPGNSSQRSPPLTTDGVEPNTESMKAQIHSLNAKVDSLGLKLDELVSMLSRQQNLSDEL